MKKRKLTAVLIAALCVVLAVPSVSWAKSGREEYITVGLKYGGAAVSQCTLKSDSGFQIVNITDDGPEDSLPLPAYTEITATAERGVITLSDRDGTLLVADLGTTGAVMPLDYEDGDGVLSCDGTAYRDGIRFTANGSGTMNVINYLTMDHYLYGVIHAEMSQSYPLEALKAQAVVARSYAHLNQHAHREYGFDVCATTHCQVYKGYSNEYPKTTQAVDETSGEMIYSEGRVVQAYYHKNSGGSTQNSEDVWSSAEPYLRGVKDIYSPDYPWTASLTFDEIQSKLTAAKYTVGTVESVAITARNSAGAVSELTIKGSAGTAVLKKESVRTVLGASAIKSTMFDLNASGGQSKPSAGEDGLTVKGSSSVKETDGKLYVQAASGDAKQMSQDKLYLTSASGTVQASGASSSGGGGAETVTGSTVQFSGKGYGHGIGMPQDSAIEMAKQGFHYDEILEFYFTGIEIR